MRSVKWIDANALTIHRSNECFRSVDTNKFSSEPNIQSGWIREFVDDKWFLDEAPAKDYETMPNKH